MTRGSGTVLKDHWALSCVENSSQGNRASGLRSGLSIRLTSVDFGGCRNPELGMASYFH